MHNLQIDYVDDPECPNDWEGGWRLVSFSPRHTTYEDPYNYIERVDRDSGDIIPANIGIKRKLECKTAFILSYYEHGLCRWGLGNSANVCPWDSSPIAGILLWEDTEWRPDMDKREKDAKEFLECYTDWANGSVYTYLIEDEEGEDIGTEGGDWYSHDLDGMFEDIRYYTKDIKGDIKVTGSAKDIAAYYQIKDAA